MYRFEPDRPLQRSPLDRRRWLRTVIGVIASAISSIVGIVAGGAVLSPGFARRRESWVPAGRLGDLREGVPTPVIVRIAREDGYYEAVDQQVVFLVKSESGHVRAMSSTCTHLGCRVSYDATRRVLKCPCHGGTFAIDGTVISGPPPGPLTELPARADGTRVFIQV